MTTIVTRAGKGSALTWTEADANFSNLNDYKVEMHAPQAYCEYGYVGVTTPITWSNTLINIFGYAAGPNAETTVVNNGGSQSVFAHGIYFGSDYAPKYTTAATTPAYISMSGGQINFNVCAAPGTPGDTATFTTPLKVIGSDESVRINDAIVGAVDGTGFRNKIINGAMRIDQRNAGSAVTINSASVTYTVDRWAGAGTGAAGVFTLGRSATSPPTGFTNFLRATVSTADASLAASDLYYIRYAIEGNDCANLDYGLSTAKEVTLSFWLRSSLTGIFTGALCNSAGNRSYPFSTTISSANTWEQKIVTIPGDVTGTWLTTSGIGIRLTFGLGVGSTFTGTASAWDAANYVGATGGTNFMGTLNATVDLAGVQLESGPVASPFEHRPHGVEYGLCQRYCVDIDDVMTISGNQQGYKYQNQFIETTLRLPETMRGNPTLEGTAITTWAATVPGATEAAGYGLAAGAYLTITGALTISIASASPGNALLRYTAATSFSGTNGENVTMFLGSGQNYRLVSEL